jgi:chromosomal replication initiator protein
MIGRGLTNASAEQLATFWEPLRAELRASVLDSTFELWLAPLRPAALRDGTLYLTAPASTIAWVERRYLELLARVARGHDSDLVDVALLPAGEQVAPDTAPAPEASPPNPHYAFDRFVIGEGTHLAHAAALAVAEAPGEAYNPLFLFGPPGLGKSHLLVAIANYIASNSPSLSVRYTTAESFTSEFVAALRAEGLDDFKRRHRQLDVLLIDDVQFLAGKEHTAEEFFHTFNVLYEAGSQLVLSSDRPPAELARLAERLRDRFEWGMLAELTPPDLATRSVILRRLAHESGLDLETSAALDSIAAATHGNVRQLQSALTRVVAVSSLQGRAIDTALASSVLGGPSPPDVSTAGAVAHIKATVARELDLEPAHLSGSGRNPRIVQARHIAIYLCRQLTDASLSQLGRSFERDHSTVLSSIRRVEKDRELTASAAAIRVELSTSLPTSRGDRDH